MKSIITVTFIFILQTALAESDHHHDHSSHEKSKLELSLNKGKKWSTDQPLRKNMSAIHDHIKVKLSKIHNNKMTGAEYQKLSKKIKGNIDDIFANCKLTPKADAQLHIVLSGMMSANSRVSGESTPTEKSSAIKEILKNYKAYLKHFDHTGIKIH